jgi:chaperonin cofactor prefoldin
MSGPEWNPADEMPATKEEYEAWERAEARLAECERERERLAEEITRLRAALESKGPPDA